VTATKLVHLGYTPRPWQQQCHQTRKRFTVLALHRRAGKTRLALMELVQAACKAAQESLFAYIAPQLNQAREIAWGELKRILEPLRVVGGCEIRESNLSVRIGMATIHLFGADRPDALRGLRLDGVVVDEVAQIQPVLWTDVLQPALADRQGWALFIGTPNGINLFSELYYAASGKPDWMAGRWTVYETAALPEVEVARLRAELPPTAFAREMLCDFAAAAEDQLISLTDVEVAAKRVYVERDVMHQPRIVGVDPARFGDDRSVIVKRQGLQMLPPMAFHGLDNMDLASRVANVMQDWQPEAVFVDSGAGAGVIDRLRQLGHNCIEVPFGGKAVRADLFVNRRVEMWWLMREWIIAGGAIPNDPVLKQELATPVYWFDQTGKKVLEGKDDIKARLKGGASPDIADALALTFAAPVVKRTELQVAQHASRQRERGSYDPYAKRKT